MNGPLAKGKELIMVGKKIWQSWKLDWEDGQKVYVWKLEMNHKVVITQLELEYPAETNFWVPYLLQEIGAYIWNRDKGTSLEKQQLSRIPLLPLRKYFQFGVVPFSESARIQDEK